MFYKKVRKDSNREMFEFLTGHYTYFTMNSWNGYESIANKVKVHSLPFRNDSCNVLAALEDDEYSIVNMMLNDFEEEHGVRVCFNGRSGGYLVLYPKQGCQHVFEHDSNSPIHYDNYENWKEDVQYDWGSLKAYQPTLIKQVELVQAFDKLCDDLIDVCDELTDNYLAAKAEEEFIEAHKVPFEATKHFEEYYYDDIENYNLHKKYMTEKGYSIYEENEDDLYIMFEMHELVEGKVFVDPRKEEK